MARWTTARPSQVIRPVRASPSFRLQEPLAANREAPRIPDLAVTSSSGYKADRPRDSRGP
jgi:hypothetical protein